MRALNILSHDGPSAQETLDLDERPLAQMDVIDATKGRSRS